MKRKFNPEQVEERINEVRRAIKQLSDNHNREEDAELQMMGHVAELNSVLSERAEIASQRLEDYTGQLVALTSELHGVHRSIRFLTVWLVVLTVALTILTSPLAYDAYLKIKQHYQPQKHQQISNEAPPQPN